MAGAWRAAHLPLGLNRCCPLQLTSVENVGRASSLLPAVSRASTRRNLQRRYNHHRVGAVLPLPSTSHATKRFFSSTPQRREEDPEEAGGNKSPLLDALVKEDEERDARARVVDRLPLDVAIRQQKEESLQKQLALARVAIKEGSTIDDLAELAPELNKEELRSYQSFIRAEYKDDAALNAAVKYARQESDKSLNSAEGKVWQEQSEDYIRQMRHYGEELRSARKDRNSFWQEEEEDVDYMVADDDDDEPKADDITTMGHAKLDELREQRQYARIAVWEMPLLAQFAKPFEPPAADEPLRFRYTSYMGEFHPAEKKVVVEFCPEDLDLTEAQQLKLKKLAGVRFNPQKGIVRMSCEQFEHQAQNKRYLGDLVEKLIADARDPTDMFEDIPLDTRHHTWKVKPKFPREWRMSEERQQQLHDMRKEAFLLDSGKQKNGTLIDGVDSIAASLNPSPREAIPELMPLRR